MAPATQDGNTAQNGNTVQDGNTAAGTQAPDAGNAATARNDSEDKKRKRPPGRAALIC